MGKKQYTVVLTKKSFITCNVNHISSIVKRCLLPENSYFPHLHSILNTFYIFGIFTLAVFSKMFDYTSLNLTVFLLQ